MAFVAFAVWSRWIGRSFLTGPMLFTAFGLLVGPLALGLVTLQPTDGMLRQLAEITLVLVLFSDAAKVDVERLMREHRWPVRMLLVGLPLAVVAGAGAGRLLFPGLGLWEACLLGAMLAATDAALAGSILEDERIPEKIRTTLTVESGLNDGLALPFVLLFAGLVGATFEGAGHWLGEAALQIGVGPLVGAAVGCFGAWLVKLGDRHEWTLDRARGIVSLAVALAAFAGAETLHGNGFLAAFVAGLGFRWTLGRRDDFLYLFEEVESKILTFLTFGAFGCVLLPAVLPAIGWRHVAFALLALTVARIVPIALSLLGTDASWRDRLVLGWLGPRGLASLLFLLLVLIRSDVERDSPLFAAVVTTVLASVVLHGLTAQPIGAWCGGHEAANQSGKRGTS